LADIKAAIAPRSDQLNYVDFMAGPDTFTIERTEDYRDEKGGTRVAIHMVERPGRPFKPSATNLRLIAIGWGDDDTGWPGRRITLGGDPEVTFGREKVGGIRVLALSDIAQPYTAKLPITRGKKAEYRVERLDTATPPPIPTFATVDAARAYYTERAKAGASPAELDAIKAAAPAAPNNEEN
jgi:hypothetical protein